MTTNSPEAQPQEAPEKLWMSYDPLNRKAEYTGLTGAACRAEARKDGWVVNVRANHGLCPNCSGKKKRQ